MRRNEWSPNFGRRMTVGPGTQHFSILWTAFATTAVSSRVDGDPTTCAALRPDRNSWTITKGCFVFGYATFQANDDPALKLAIYAPLPRCE